MRIDLDVSDLPPCEPLERVLETVQTLAVGDWLQVLHRQEPFPLYHLLEQGGFSWRTLKGAEHGFEIRIWRTADPAAEKNAQETD